MSNDIAVLGLAVDSNPVEKATAELQTFAQTSKTAEAAAQSFSRSTQQAGTATQQMAASINKAVNSAQAINDRLGVKDSFASGDRAADIAAYMQQMDALRAKFNPLYAAEQQQKKAIDEINQAAKVGAISEQERAAAVGRTEAAYRNTVAGIGAAEKALMSNTKAAGLSSYAMTNLSFQINDAATMALSGASAFQILATQGGQVFQILQMGNGGVTGSLKEIGSRLLSLITPFRLAAAGFIGVGAAAAIAFHSFLEQEREAQLAVIGIGGAAGLTAQSFRSIGDAAAAAGQATVGEARTMLAAFAATGKIGEDAAKQAIALGRNFQRVFGVDATEAASMLAKALADPGKGVEDLNRRLGAFDAKTLQHIKSLQAQNDYYAAQKLLLAGVADATKAAEIPVSSLEKAWLKLKDTASEYYNLTGKAINSAFGGGTLEDQVAKKQEELDRLINSRGGPEEWFAITRAAKQAGIDRVTREILALAESMAKVSREAEQAKLRVESVRIAGLADGIAPANSELQRLKDTLIDLQKAMGNPGITAGMSPEQLDTLRKAEETTKRRVQYFATGLELAKQEQAIALQQINAQTVAQRAAAEYAAQVARLRREGDPDAEAKAQMMAQRVLAENAAQITREQREQLLTASQRVQQAQMELGLVGANAETQDRIRAQTQLRLQAEQEALRLYGNKDAYDKAHLEALEREAAIQARITQQVREQQLMQDIRFERAQMGRTEMEQDVYSRLKSAGMLTNGEIQGAAAEAAAAQIRLNYTIKQSIDSSKEFTQGFVRDMLAGKSATEALGNALNKLAQRLADLAIDNAFSALFGGGGTSGLGGLLGGGLKPGGAAQVPTFHSGGIVGVNDNNPSRLVHPAIFAGAARYHGGGIAGLQPGEVPAILKKGEVVLQDQSALKSGITINMPLSIDARGAYPESIAEIRAAFAQLESSIPTRAVSAVQQAQNRRII